MSPASRPSGSPSRPPLADDTADPRALVVALPSLASEAARAERIGGWDLQRALAFVDVAWLHLTDGYALGGIGLPTFLLLGIALSIRTTPGEALAAARKRVARLLVPWLVWNVPYAALSCAEAFNDQEPLFGWVTPRSLVAGAYSHLWFLPFVVALSQFAELVDRRTRHIPVPRMCLACGAAAALMVAFLGSGELPEPFHQWRFSLPALPLGLALGRIRAQGLGPSERLRNLLTLGLAFSAIAVTLAWGDAHASAASRRYALALAGLIALSLVRQLPRWVAEFRQLQMACYLLHPGVHTVLVAVTLRVMADRPPAPVQAVLTIVTTVASAAILRRTPLRRFL